jgi:hypothetical protein
MNSTQSFFTPEDSKLPDGTYIATGLAGVTLLAEYLDTHPETSVLHLLISDSTVQDTETGHGYLSYTNIEDLAHEDYHYIIDDRKPRSPPLTDEQEDEQEDIRHTNVKTTLRLKRAVRDIEAPLTRVFERVAPVLEGLMFLTYISDPVAFDRRRATVTGEPVDPRIAALAGLTYPSLTQLIFLNQHIDCAAQVLKDPGRFPALTHLHVYEDSTRLAVFVEHFPHLTHLLLTGATSVYSLPPDFNPAYPPPTWMDRFKETVLRIPHQRPPM